MRKKILITGATDGIGAQTAQLLAAEGHTLLLHGRSVEKLNTIKTTLAARDNTVASSCYQADLSCLIEVDQLARDIAAQSQSYAIDVIINNAGVFRTSAPITTNGLDTRFVVNALAPYLLTRRLLPHLNHNGRIINVSSAAQATVNLAALRGETTLSDDFEAYAQSKLALTMWSHALAQSPLAQGRVVVAVNPGSMLGSKMVQEGFGVTGGDLTIGADILRHAALSETFSSASGQYFDNDQRQFTTPHPDAFNPERYQPLMQTITQLLTDYAIGPI